MHEGVRILPIQYMRYLKGSLTCHKILQHGTSSFTSHLKEDVLGISIALKNASPRPDLNLWSLGPVASTLATTPLRRLFADDTNIISSQPEIECFQNCMIDVFANLNKWIKPVNSN
jgi:hypothetical protein